MSLGTSKNPPWAAKISALRDRLKLNQGDFAKLAGTTQSNVSKWEKGVYKPSPENFMRLAELAKGDPDQIVFMELGGVPKAYFLGDTAPGMMPTVVAEQAIKEAQQTRVAELAASGVLREAEGAIRHIPLLKDSAAAGTPRAVDERELDRLMPLPADWLPRGGNLFGVRVSGDSMSPILLNGHIAIVDVSKRDQKKLIRHMVAARNEEGVTIKWLRDDGGIYSLVPQHVAPEYQVQYLKPLGPYEVIGEVVLWIGTPPKARK